MAGSIGRSSSEDVMPVALSVVGLIWYATLWSIGLLGCRIARKRYRLRPRSPLATAPRASVPGVSILRPLKGLDTNLYENLESTFAQEYPNFEILFSVAEEDDQALSVVRDLLAKYPNVNARIVIGEEIVGVNPKVNNLIRSYRQAANDIIWVLDSNVMVTPGTLGRSVDALNSTTHSKRVGLVHHVPFAFTSGWALGSRIEEAFLNTNHAKMYIAINTVAIESCVVGKSNLYRRSDLERVSGSLKPLGTCEDLGHGDCGLPAFGRFLAEDNMIGSALWHELGLRHELSCDTVRNVVGNMSFSDYVWRRVRWIRVRKRMTFAATLVEPLTESVVLSIIGFASLTYLASIPAWLFFFTHFALWLYVDCDVYASLVGHPVPSESRWAFIGAWVARELLALPIWILAIVGNRVEWRGKMYRIMRNGEVEAAGRQNEQTIWLSWLNRKRRKDHYERLDDNTN